MIVAEPGVALGDKDADALDVASSMLNGFGGTLFDQAGSVWVNCQQLQERWTERGRKNPPPLARCPFLAVPAML